MVLEQKEVELQHKEAGLQGKEAKLQREKATIATLSGTLEEKGKALEEKEVAIRNAEAALKEKDSLSSLEEATRVQREEARKNIAGECSRFSLLLDPNLSQLILILLIRAEAESGGRDCGEGGGQHRAHGSAGRIR